MIENSKNDKKDIEEVVSSILENKSLYLDSKISKITIKNGCVDIVFFEKNEKNEKKDVAFERFVKISLVLLVVFMVFHLLFLTPTI